MTKPEEFAQAAADYCVGAEPSLLKGRTLRGDMLHAMEIRDNFRRAITALHGACLLRDTTTANPRATLPERARAEQLYAAAMAIAARLVA